MRDLPILLLTVLLTGLSYECASAIEIGLSKRQFNGVYPEPNPEGPPRKVSTTSRRGQKQLTKQYRDTDKEVLLPTARKRIMDQKKPAQTVKPMLTSTQPESGKAARKEYLKTKKELKGYPSHFSSYSAERHLPKPGKRFPTSGMLHYSWHPIKIKEIEETLADIGVNPYKHDMEFEEAGKPTKKMTVKRQGWWYKDRYPL